MKLGCGFWKREVRLRLAGRYVLNGMISSRLKGPPVPQMAGSTYHQKKQRRKTKKKVVPTGFGPGTSVEVFYLGPHVLLEQENGLFNPYLLHVAMILERVIYCDDS
jgi:hypothetical protein